MSEQAQPDSGEPTFTSPLGAEELVPPSAEVEIAPEIVAVLERHIVDIVPMQDGPKEHLRSMGNAAIGLRGVEIHRPDPSLKIPGEASLVRGVSKVLVARNGAGKSTFLDALMERDAHVFTGHGEGAYVFNTPVHERAGLRVARLDQEEMLDAIGHHMAGTVLEQAAAYFKQQFPVDEDGWGDPEIYEHNLRNDESQRRIDELMGRIADMFDMEEFLATDVADLSGGERTKLALFMMLLSEPDVLLLDEPTNHLDLKGVTLLTELFKRYKDAGVAIVSASHVPSYLEQAGDGVLEITHNKDGRQLRSINSPYSEYRKNPALESQSVITGPIPWLQAEYYSYKRGESLVAGPASFSIPDSPLVNVGMPYIHGGDFIVLSGENGSGKTRLMEAIAASRSLDGPKKQEGAQVAYLPQFWPKAVAQGTVGEFFGWVKQGASPLSTGAADHPTRNPESLFISLAKNLSFAGAGRIGESWLRAPLASYSGGEQRMLWFLAVASLRDVDMLMLDEPTNHMDHVSQGRIAEAIRAFPGAVMLSTHDPNLIKRLFNARDQADRARKPDHWVLEKQNGQTSLKTLEVSPMDYMERVMETARQRAKRFKVEA